jgi:phage terminase large subunit-like protein
VPVDTPSRRKARDAQEEMDTANKATELSPHPNPPPHTGEGREGCTTWGIAGNNLYLVDLVRRRMEYPELKREVRAQYERFRPSVVLIEDKASGTQLIQRLIQEGLYAVTASSRRPTRSCACTRRPQ